MEKAFRVICCDLRKLFGLKSFLFRNVVADDGYEGWRVPLAAIVRLSQAPYNKIERLNGLQAYACLYPSVSAYRPERKVADGIHDSLSRVAAAVPCFQLDCLPDADAAKLSCKTIYG